MPKRYSSLIQPVFTNRQKGFIYRGKLGSDRAGASGLIEKRVEYVILLRIRLG